MGSNHSQDSILKLTRNFQQARIVLTGAELDIFTLLDSDPMTVEQVTQKINGNLKGVEILLDALAALGFLIKKNEAYQTEISVSKLLSSKAPDSVLPMVKHSARLWRTWSRLTDIAGDKDISKDREDTGFDMEEMRAFIGAMHVVGSGFAPKVVEAVNPSGFKKLLDIGGGSGTYTIAFLNAVPAMKATLFDLPPVIEWARERFDQSGLSNRVTLIPGDFYKDELPGGHDLAFISAIIHQNSPKQNGELYEKSIPFPKSGGQGCHSGFCNER